MGRIQRSQRNKANQRVAAARTLEVKIAETDLLSAIEPLLETWNEAADEHYEAKLATMGRMARWAASNTHPATRHFHILDCSDHLMITYGMTAARIVERGFNPAVHAWIATLYDRGRNDGFRRIEVSLVQWAVNDRGFIWNGDRYVALLDGLVSGLAGRYVSDPIDEDDHRFISYA